MPLSVVILAAGQGRRMHSDLPKVLQPLAGTPLLHHVLRTARALNPAGMYVVHGHGGAQVQAACVGQPIEWVLQAEQLGTGHAVIQAMRVIPDDHTVLVMYGDVPLVAAESLRGLVAAANGDALALLSVELADAAGYGRVVRDAHGQIRSIVEHKDAGPAELNIREANTGLLAAPAVLLRGWLDELDPDNAQREYYLTDVVAGAVRSGTRVEAVSVADPLDVLGVNDKRQLAQAEAAYRRRRTDELMLAGVTLVDPARVDVRGEVLAGRDVFIDINAVLIGTVTLGARVRIGPNCVIRDAVIGADTEIFANSLIEQAVIGHDCRVGPYARLRPGTVLQEAVHIGNFVELKETLLGAGSKANHLSYLGDAVIGQGVNIGAGSITCNYDGANKWPTVIDDGAFIGSGSMLVAPLTIGARATVGAGSTVTSNAPRETLTLTRAPQVTIEGWRRRERLSAADRAALLDCKAAPKKT